LATNKALVALFKLIISGFVFVGLLSLRS